ncbi:nucleoside phosphorylase domain-containing protein [Aspergillus spectabilis]
MPTSLYFNDEYTVGWVSMLDDEHGDAQTTPGEYDDNTYILGAIGKHKIVVVCLPRDHYGAISAAAVAKDMLHTFQQIRFGLMVRIDIRLGDVVVGSDNRNGGVVLYDFGKRLADGSFEAMYALDQPPRSLRTALSRLESDHMLQGSQISVFVDRMQEMYPSLRDNGWGRPDKSTDLLFRLDHQHVAGRTCLNYDKPAIHYGTIATGSAVVKHSATRDEIKHVHGAICLEMEAASLMNNFPYLIIRGISDYANLHKNDGWRNYAEKSL